MRGVIAAALLLALAGCTTPQVTAACEDGQALAEQVAPYAQIEPHLGSAVAILRVGTRICGSPEYAQAREIVLGFIRERLGRQL